MHNKWRFLVTYFWGFIPLCAMMFFIIPFEELKELAIFGGVMLGFSCLVSSWIKNDCSNNKGVGDVIASAGILIAIANIFIYNETSKPGVLPQHWHVAVFCLGLGYFLGLLNYYLPAKRKLAI